MSTRVPGVLVPFRHASYRRLAVALVLSSFAAGVWIVGLVWEVIRIDGGPGQLSAVTTANAVGLLLPAMLGGVVADRVRQKLVLLGVASLEVVGMSLVAVLSLSDVTQLWHLMAVSFATGVGMAFYYPAYNAWLPALVPESDLLAVNGFEGMVRPTVGQAIGPAVAGVVVGAASAGAAVGVAAVSSALGLLVLATVPITPLRRDLTGGSGGHPVSAALSDMREGFGYLRRTPWLLATLLFASLMVLVFMGPFEVLIPYFVKDHLGGGPSDHALVLAAFGIGGAVGALAMGSLRMPRRYLTVMNIGWGLGCLPLAFIGFADDLWVVVVAGFVLGVGFSAPGVIWGTLLQRRVPPELLGRVASLDFFVSLSLMPISMALAGPVSALIGVQTTFVVAGVVPVLAAVAATLWWRLPADEIAHPLDVRPPELEPVDA
ncbi:MAG: transporter [Nocardioidaceae bacterium]|nr:transporter [Nocardioidaceae bacterium]